MSAIHMPQRELPDERSVQLEEVFAETRAVLLQTVEQAVEKALDKLRAGVATISRFANLKEIDAACVLLEERGEPLHMEEIVRELKRGGLWKGPSSSRGGKDADMKRSIARFASRNEGHGDRIRYFGDKIGKIEWHEGQFPGPKK